MNEEFTRYRLLSRGIILMLAMVMAVVIVTTNAAAAVQIYGTVTDAETDRPIERAMVNIYLLDSKDAATETYTNDRGYYEAEIEPGSYYIHVSSGGYTDHKGEVNIDVRTEHNIKLTPGSGSKDDTDKDNYTKDDTTKDDTTKDDTTRDDTTRDDTTREDPAKDDADDKSGIGNSVPLVIAAAILVVVGIVVGFFIGKKKGQKNSDNGALNKDDWTTCPECGTSLQQKNLSSHLDSVHQKSPKTNKREMTVKKGAKDTRIKRRMNR